MILGKLKGSVESFFRYKVGEDTGLSERAVKEQEVLGELRRLPHFAALMDQFDGELRALFQQFMDSETPEQAIALQAEARAFSRMSRRLEGAVTARDKGEAAEENARRQIELMKVDADRRRHMRRTLDQRRPAGQNN